MIAILDVDYRTKGAVAACVLAAGWDSAEPERVLVATIDEVAPYEPGRFYLRELPCLLAVLAKIDAPLRSRLEAIVVDGHVWLDEDRPGLGAKLYDALGSTTPVVGIAKNAFHGNTRAISVLRGESKNALWVSTIGALEVHDAAARVRAMHGPHRIPTLLARTDRAARDG